MSSSSEPNKNENDNNGDDSIEKAFDWLHKAKEYSKKGDDSWKAADAYVQGRAILERLAQQAQQTTTAVEEEEQQMIQDLYQQKAREYLFEARKSLLDAMTKENASDQERNTNSSSSEQPPHFQTLTDEQAQQRIKTFYTLYSKPVDLSSQEQQQSQPSSDEQAWSLEERLMELNSSLPKGFKTSEERMDDINRGLNRLGLSLYTQKEPFSRVNKNEEVVPKDEDEQVEDIIAQATEEAEFNKQHEYKESSSSSGRNVNEDNFDDLSSSSDDDDDDEGENDTELDDEIFAMKQIQKQATKALLKLGEVVGTLDDAKALKRRLEEEEGLHDDDSEKDQEAEIQTMLRDTKLKLRRSQRALAKAMAEWTDSNLP